MKKAIVVLLGVMLAAGSYGADDQLLKIGGEGKIAIVNTCDAPTGEIDIALRKACSMMMINYEFQKGSWSLVDAQKSFDAAKANVAVFIINDKTLPMSLIAMESKWGVVNAEGLDEKGIMKETLRVATILLGGASSKYPASTMRPVFDKEGLVKAGEYITFDSIMRITDYLPELGIKPYQMMTREDAIEEGLIKADAKK